MQLVSNITLINPVYLVQDLSQINAHHVKMVFIRQQMDIVNHVILLVKLVLELLLFVLHAPIFLIKTLVLIDVQAINSKLYKEVFKHVKFVMVVV